MSLLITWEGQTFSCPGQLNLVDQVFCHTSLFEFDFVQKL